MTTMAGEHYNDLERAVGNLFVLAEPMVDGYIKQLGGSTSLKLNGLAAPINVYSTAANMAPSKWRFPLDEFVRANRIFSSQSMRSFILVM